VPAPEAAVPPGTVRVPYIPEVVRRQIRDEVRADLVAQARAEGWAAPGATPEWVSRFRLYGDLRLRAEAVRFPSGNAIGFFPDFRAINNSSGFDQNGTDNAPFLNVDQDRTRFRLRARAGFDAQVDDGVTAGFRIATGNDSSPVSTNQTLGQNGNFSRYELWLDRAFLRFDPLDWLTVQVGRMHNPFFTTDLLFDEDLGFDGIAVQGRWRPNDRFGIFGTAGAFPVFNTDFAFATTDVSKSSSRDKYLYGVQGGLDWRIRDGLDFRFGVGWYNFANIEGQLSSPCAIPYAADACDTDLSRPQFQQTGNTLFPIRNIVADPNNPDGPQPQFYGLASPFTILDLNARLDVTGFRPYLLRLEGNYLQNLDFDRGRIERRGPVNNLAANTNVFQGGSMGWLLRATFGHRDPQEQRWNWNLFLGYRYLESDAVLDAFTDSDFRLGGSNSQGFTLGGSLGLARNVALTARWLSGNEVSGPPFQADVFQLDLNARF
jgi:hypothetical protein